MLASLFTQYKDADGAGDEVTQVGFMDVAEDVDPGYDYRAVALVARDLQAQQVLSLHRQDGEGRSGGESIQHGRRQENRDEPQPENSHKDLEKSQEGLTNSAQLLLSATSFDRIIILKNISTKLWPTDHIWPALSLCLAREAVGVGLG